LNFRLKSEFQLKFNIEIEPRAPFGAARVSIWARRSTSPTALLPGMAAQWLHLLPVVLGKYG
jgi:hypothetical protein